MAHTVYAVASGKGGVGKTATTVNLGAALAEQGHTVAIVDADLGMANLGGFLGLNPDGPTLHEVLAGEAQLQNAIYEIGDGLAAVPSGISLEGFADIETEALSEAISGLRDLFDYVLLDLGAGLSHDTVLPLALADAVVLVSTPKPVALQDTAKTHQVTKRLGGAVAGVVLTRATDPQGLQIDAISERLGLPILAVIPEDVTVDRSALAGKPVVASHPDTPATAGFRGLADIVIAESLANAPVVPSASNPHGGAQSSPEESAEPEPADETPEQDTIDQEPPEQDSIDEAPTDQEPPEQDSIDEAPTDQEQPVQDSIEEDSIDQVALEQDIDEHAAPDAGSVDPVPAEPSASESEVEADFSSEHEVPDPAEAGTDVISDVAIGEQAGDSPELADDLQPGYEDDSEPEIPTEQGTDAISGAEQSSDAETSDLLNPTGDAPAADPASFGGADDRGDELVGNTVEVDAAAEEIAAAIETDAPTDSLSADGETTGIQFDPDPTETDDTSLTDDTPTRKAQPMDGDPLSFGTDGDASDEETKADETADDLGDDDAPFSVEEKEDDDDDDESSGGLLSRFFG